MEPTTGALLLSGIKLMLIGMGTVFLFLALLVWVIGMTARIFQHYLPEVPSHLNLPPNAAASSSSPDSVRREMVAAITAAIHQYRNRSR